MEHNFLKEFTPANIGYTICQVEFQIIPRIRIGDHVPAGCIGTMFFNGLERVDSIAESFGHFIAVFVQD